jgi:hypothetical protein
MTLSRRPPKAARHRHRSHCLTVISLRRCGSGRRQGPRSRFP